MDRATVSGTVCRRFNSSRAYHFESRSFYVALNPLIVRVSGVIKALFNLIFGIIYKKYYKVLLEKKNSKMKWLKHFNTINNHKYWVMHYCFKAGLYKQGILHDLSKYNPAEFLVGAKYFLGNDSPNNAERRDIGYSSSWLHHKGRNKHHWEYWVDFTRSGLKPAKMPNRYILEMFCDRVAASMIYQGKNYHDHHPLEYYNGGKHSYIMHPHTRSLLEKLLIYLDEHGLDATIQYIKENIDKNG